MSALPEENHQELSMELRIAVLPRRLSGLPLGLCVCLTTPTAIRPSSLDLLAVPWELFSCVCESIPLGRLLVDGKQLCGATMPSSWFTADHSAEVNLCLSMKESQLAHRSG